jgi:Flp pilus assembly protein TadD
VKKFVYIVMLLALGIAFSACADQQQQPDNVQKESQKEVVKQETVQKEEVKQPTISPAVEAKQDAQAYYRAASKGDYIYTLRAPHG